MEDRKYRLAFVNRVSGEAIPDDEPVFVLRARDYHAISTLRYYMSRCHDEHHRQAIQETIDLFDLFERAHPDRMKEPGITHHFKHAEEKDTSAPTWVYEDFYNHAGMMLEFGRGRFLLLPAEQRAAVNREHGRRTEIIQTAFAERGEVIDYHDPRFANVSEDK